MKKIDLIIDALSVAQNSVWSALNQEALAYAIELKLELAKPKQELVAWLHPDKKVDVVVPTSLAWFDKPIPLYTASPRKPWQGLTDDEIHKIIDCCTPNNAAQEELNDFARAVRFVEAKLREKNLHDREPSIQTNR